MEYVFHTLWFGYSLLYTLSTFDWKKIISRKHNYVEKCFWVMSSTNEHISRHDRAIDNFTTIMKQQFRHRILHSHWFYLYDIYFIFSWTLHIGGVTCFIVLLGFSTVLNMVFIEVVLRLWIWRNKQTSTSKTHKLEKSHFLKVRQTYES